MEREYDKLQKEYARKSRLFKFWIKLAQKANQKAAMANMSCDILTEKMVKLSNQMYDQTSEETCKMDTES